MTKMSWLELMLDCEDLGDYIDYMATVTSAPKDYQEFRGRRLTLDEAFAGLRDNLKKFEKRIKDPKVIAQGYKTFDEAYEHYNAGRILEANTIMDEFQYLLRDVRSGKHKRQA